MVGVGLFLFDGWGEADGDGGSTNMSRLCDRPDITFPGEIEGKGSSELVLPGGKAGDGEPGSSSM